MVVVVVLLKVSNLLDRCIDLCVGVNRSMKEVSLLLKHLLDKKLIKM